MAQIDDLNAAVGNIQGDVTALGTTVSDVDTKVTTAVTMLQAIQAPGVDLTAPIANLTAAHTTLSGLATALAAADTSLTGAETPAPTGTASADAAKK